MIIEIKGGCFSLDQCTANRLRNDLMSVDKDPDGPNPLHTQGLLHASVSQQLEQLQENLNVLTLDVACFFGGSYYFLCPDIIKEKNKKKKKPRMRYSKM